MSLNFLDLLDDYKFGKLEKRKFEHKLNYLRNLNLVKTFINDDLSIDSYFENDELDFGNNFVFKRFKISDIDFINLDRQKQNERFICSIEAYCEQVASKFLVVFRGPRGKYPIITLLNRCISHFVDAPTPIYIFDLSKVFFNDIIHFIENYKFGNYCVKIDNEIRLIKEIHNKDQSILEFDKTFVNRLGLEKKNLMLSRIDLNFFDDLCALKLDIMDTYYYNFYMDLIDCLFYVENIMDLVIFYNYNKARLSIVNFCFRKFRETFKALTTFVFFCTDQETVEDVDKFIRKNQLGTLYHVEKTFVNRVCIIRINF